MLAALLGVSAYWPEYPALLPLLLPLTCGLVGLRKEKRRLAAAAARLATRAGEILGMTPLGDGKALRPPLGKRGEKPADNGREWLREESAIGCEVDRARERLL